MFWPTKTAALDGLVRSHAALDQLGTLAVDQKGLFAIEHLLFPAGGQLGDLQNQLISPEGERSRWLLCGLAGLVSEAARATKQALGDGREFRRSLLDGDHESIKLVLNNIGSTVSSVITDPGAVLRSEVESGPDEVRGGASQLAFAITERRIAAAQRLYAGESSACLAELVKATSPEVHTQVTTDFERALTDLRALPANMAPALAPPSARRAAASAVHALELVVKNDLATALGAPLLFGLPHED